MRRFPAAFRPPAFASRSSFARRGIQPSSRSACRTTDPDLVGVSAFRTHELRPGWAPSVPRGRRCSSRPGPLPGRRLPLRSGQSLHPANHPIDGVVALTRHQPRVHTCSPGKPGASLRRAPLRTGRAPFDASGSNKRQGLAGGQKRWAFAAAGAVPVAAVGVHETAVGFVRGVELPHGGLDDRRADGVQPSLPLARALRLLVDG